MLVNHKDGIKNGIKWNDGKRNTAGWDEVQNVTQTWLHTCRTFSLEKMMLLLLLIFLVQFSAGSRLWLCWKLLGAVNGAVRRSLSSRVDGH